MHQQYQNPRNYETSNKRDYQDYSRASSRSNYNNGAISEEPNANVVIQGLGYETNEQQVNINLLLCCIIFFLIIYTGYICSATA